MTNKSKKVKTLKEKLSEIVPKCKFCGEPRLKSPHICKRIKDETGGEWVHLKSQKDIDKFNKINEKQK